MRQLSFVTNANQMWTRILVISCMLFLVYFGDAVLSDWVPAYMQKSLGSPLVMGLVMAFSSVVGFTADLWFPSKLKLLRAKRILVMAIGTSMIFAGLLWWTTYWQYVGLFLSAMAVWGVYYEFLRFGSHQFVSESVPVILRSAVWAIFGMARSMAYFFGPLVGSLITVEYGDRATVIFACVLSVGGYLVWKFGLTSRKDPIDGDEEHVNLIIEVKRWGVLAKRVWTVLLVSFSMGLIDACFWTTGTVLTDKLVKEHWMGGMFLPFYMLPVIVVGLMIARLKVHEHKKKYAELALVVAGVLLLGVGMTHRVEIWLLLVLGVGAATAVVSPLVDAVYTDVSSRMGSERKHMIGLASSTGSLAYVVGPIVAGALATVMSEPMVFSVVGGYALLVGIILLIVTPKKIHLPQAEIDSWR